MPGKKRQLRNVFHQPEGKKKPASTMKKVDHANIAFLNVRSSANRQKGAP
jgi:hypothetical protein